MSVKINENYLLLESNYLFAEISRRVEKYQKDNPDTEIIKMGIGDVTKPLPKAVVEAFKDAVIEMGNSETFMGYGPEQGYSFLIDEIIENDYRPRGIELSPDEVFISDAAKCDTANIQEIFGLNNTIAVTDPVYPVYVDSNVMAGRTGPMQENGRYQDVVYMPCTAENNFIPSLPMEPVNIIYLCLPNNPTGTALKRDELAKWVEYARKNDSIILFDAAYEAYVTDDETPRSIYEIEGAKEVAMEFRSFSKNAGFTGTRCAFVVVPKALKAVDSDGNKHDLNSLWNRRQTTKFNGVSYPVQRAAQAVYTPEAQKEIKENIDYYLKNAAIIKGSMEDIGLKVYGGVNSPYIWVKTPENMDSWTFFDLLLSEANVVGTPGVGFGPSGEGYFRLTAFNTLENTKEAMERISKLSI